MTKLTLENKYGKYSIEVPEEDLTINELMESLIVNILLAAGYNYNHIAEYFPEILTYTPEE